LCARARRFLVFACHQMKEGAGARTEQAKQGAQEAGAKTQEHAQARAARFCFPRIALTFRGAA
jgi:hypothetical protein